MSGTASKATRSIFGDLLDVAGNLLLWQNEALRRMLQRGSLSQADELELRSLARIELGVDKGVLNVARLTQADIPAHASSSERIDLVSLGQVENLNAIRCNQPLRFGTNLTVIFGQNGSGKSGYARILKKALKARVPEDLLPNVYDKATTTSPARATLEVLPTGATTASPVTWIDAPNPPFVAPLAVLDKLCADSYFKKGPLQFLPHGLRLLEELVALTDRVKAELKAEQARLPNRAAELETAFSSSTKVRAAIDALAKKPDTTALTALAATPVDGNAVTELNAEVATLTARKPDEIRKSLHGRRSVIRQLRDLIDSAIALVSDDAAQTLHKLARQEATTADAWKKSSGIAPLTETEAALLELAAEQFAAGNPDAGFPGEVGTQCELCHQPLSSEAQARMSMDWQRLTDDAATAHKNASAVLKSATDALAAVKTMTAQLDQLEPQLQATDGSLVAPAREWLELAASRAVTLEGVSASPDWTPGELKIDFRDDVQRRVDEITEMIEGVADDALAQTKLATAQTELNELQALQLLPAKLNIVEDHASSLARSAILAKAMRKLTTNKISSASTEMVEHHAQDEYRAQVTLELTKLGIPKQHPRIQSDTRKGAVDLRMELPDAKLGQMLQVWSEGEQTAVALACFLAELHLGGDHVGMVFDDPVNSLDHVIRLRIAKRLVGEATKRQLIVFTHDLAFYEELLRCANQHEPSPVAVVPQCVTNPREPGFVIDGPPWDGMNVAKRVETLATDLDALDQKVENGNDVQYEIHAFYSRMRATWERSVEELVFNGVIRRFQQEVKTLSLTGSAVDDATVASVFDGMRRTSEVTDAHDSAAAQNVPTPTLEETRDELAKLRSFIEQQSGRKKAAEAGRRHLKASATTK